MMNNRLLIGIAYFVAANFLTGTVDAISKLLTGEMHALQVVWGYFVSIAFFVLGFAVVTRMPAREIYRTRRAGLQILRAAALVMTIGTLFAGLKFIPLADATAITFSAPLIVVALSAPILGERVGVHRWAAVVAGMLGVLIVIRPTGEVVHLAVLLPLAAAAGFAAFQIITRKLSDTETTFVTLLYTSVGGAAMATVLVFFVWTPLDFRQAAILAGIGALGAAAHLCFIRAFGIAQASLLAPFNYTKLIWVTGFGYLMFGDIPVPHVILGSLIIVASGLYVLLRERGRPIS